MDVRDNTHDNGVYSYLKFEKNDSPWKTILIKPRWPVSRLYELKKRYTKKDFKTLVKTIYD